MKRHARTRATGKRAEGQRGRGVKGWSLVRNSELRPPELGAEDSLAPACVHREQRVQHLRACACACARAFLPAQLYQCVSETERISARKAIGSCAFARRGSRRRAKASEQCLQCPPARSHTHGRSRLRMHCCTHTLGTARMQSRPTHKCIVDVDQGRGGLGGRQLSEIGRLQLGGDDAYETLIRSSGLGHTVGRQLNSAHSQHRSTRTPLVICRV